MKCIFCSEDTKVTDKRDSDGETRRRRECLKCGKRFTTYEKVEDPNLIVIKKDMSREPFSREKIRNGIKKACEKRPIETEKIDRIVNEVERRLRNKIKGKEVDSRVIGEEVMKELKKLDNVAYIRFASVYRDFKDISDFKQIVKDVSDKNQKLKSTSFKKEVNKK